MSAHDSLSQEVAATGFEKFLEDNFRKLVWLFIIAVIAIIAYGVIHHQMTLKDNEAAEAFTAVKTVEDCDLVISRYSGTNAAANALLIKADLLWTQNKKTSAIDALKEFTTKHANHPLAVQTLLGLGSKLDSMGDRKEAQAIFERIVNEFASSEAAPLAQVRLGDLLWAEGKAEEAKKAYEDLAVKFPEQGEFQTLSQNRLGWIAAALPTKEVDAPPAPKVEAPAAGAAPAFNMPKFNLKAADSGIGATIAPPGGTTAAPAAMSTTSPAAATTPAVQVVPQPAAAAKPAAVTPAPAPAPAAVKPAPAPSTPPAPAPAAKPTPAPASSVPPAPPAAKPTPAAPASTPPAPAAGAPAVKP